MMSELDCVALLQNKIKARLGKTSINSSLTDTNLIKDFIQKTISENDDCTRADADHSLKRRLSFEILDGLLKDCANNTCPFLDLEYHNYLIDISAEGYILERAYYYSADKEKKDEKESYFSADSRIRKIFSCSISTPKLNDKLFKIDNEDLDTNQNHQQGAINRKAYWRSLSRKKQRRDGDPNTDYSDSCDFVKKITSNDPTTLNELFFTDYIDMVNGVDLFRFCFMRANSKKPTSTSNM
jgi:hypothetical protein